MLSVHDFRNKIDSLCNNLEAEGPSSELKQLYVQCIRTTLSKENFTKLSEHYVTINTLLHRVLRISRKIKNTTLCREIEHYITLLHAATFQDLRLDMVKLNPIPSTTPDPIPTDCGVYPIYN